jgi:hypothetical protein
LLMCISPVLQNFLPIVKYYKSLKKPTERQKRLRSIFVDREDKTRIELKFLLEATGDLNTAIHNTKQKLEQILFGQLGKIVDDSVLNNLDEDDNLVRKSSTEVVDMDMDNVKMLSNKKMFIGQEVIKELKAMGLSPESVQILWFF